MFRLLVLTAAAGALALLAPNRVWAEPKHRHLHHALHELREAHKELKDASHDFGGHREKALKDINTAIEQVEKALEAAGDPFKGFSPDKGIYKDYKNHPHLRHVHHQLNEAHKEMKEAKHDFGGHRDKALSAIE